MTVLLPRSLHELSLQLVMNQGGSPTGFALSLKFNQSQNLSADLSHVQMKV